MIWKPELQEDKIRESLGKSALSAYSLSLIEQDVFLRLKAQADLISQIIGSGKWTK